MAGAYLSDLVVGYDWKPLRPREALWGGRGGGMQAALIHPIDRLMAGVPRLQSRRCMLNSGFAA